MSRRNFGIANFDRHKRQVGMASIIITLVTMIVISLIVLGFAAISRREQRQTLDQQLSTQAFYAAETAVEDARNVIKTRIDNDDVLRDKTDCITDDQGGGYPSGLPAMRLNTADGVSYSCLKVDLSPTSLSYDGVDASNIVVPVRAAAGNINRIEIEWRPATTPANTPAACPSGTVDVFSSQPDWACGYGVLRADLVPAEGGLDRNGLVNGTMAGYFVPVGSGSPSGQVSYVSHSGPANNRRPALTQADCDNGATYGSCLITVTNLNGDDEFMLRLSSLYRTSNVEIRAYQNAGSPLELVGTQAIIDATGKAQDVLRRIQVRMPLIASNVPLPGSALQSSGSICKRFNSAPGIFGVADDIVEPDATNRMCDRNIQDP